MSKRRNKNKKAGPVKVIRPEQAAAPVVVDAPEVHAMPEAHEVDDAHPTQGTQDTQDNPEAHEVQFAEGMSVAEEMSAAEEVPASEGILFAEEMSVADEMPASEEVPVSEDVSFAEEMSVADEMVAAEEVPVSAQMPVSEEISIAGEIPIVEMDMPEAAPYGAAARQMVDVEDPSAALAQAIEVDPDSIAAKPAQVESIRIIEGLDATIEMREQGAAEGQDESIARHWEPVGAATNGTAVSFDLAESDASAPEVAEVPTEKGRKPDRKLKLNKLQKHARTAPAPEPEVVAPEPEPVPEPKPPREPRIAAFARLHEYQTLSLAHVPGLPEESDVPGHWRGVGFGLGGRRLVTAFDEVVEIMRMPQITHVPGTQPWMLGVANVRGTLLPVVDLKQFLEGERTAMHEGQRVLVVRQSGGNVAVLIDQLYGQRSFNDSQKMPTAADRESRYGYFIKQVYRVGDNDWGVFSMSMLTRTPEFRQAAA